MGEMTGQPVPSSPLRRAAVRARASAAAVYHWMQRASYRALHPIRHQRARRAIARLRPSRIVVLCYGNICRSPFLEAALRQRLPGVAVTSAGLAGPGRGVPEHGLRVAAARGLDLASHRSKLVTADLLRATDLLLVMDQRQARHVVLAYGYSGARIVIAGDLDPAIGDTRAIRDPWREPIDVFEASYERLERCAVVLTQVLTSTARRP